MSCACTEHLKIKDLRLYNVTQETRRLGMLIKRLFAERLGAFRLDETSGYQLILYVSASNYVIRVLLKTLIFESLPYEFDFNMTKMKVFNKIISTYTYSSKCNSWSNL